MIPSKRAGVGAGRRQKHPILTVPLTLLLALVLLAPVASAAPPQAGQDLTKVSTPILASPQPQAPQEVRLKVVSARYEPRANDGDGVAKGALVTEYQFQIVEDNTGNPFPLDNPLCFKETNTQYPDGCDWPGVRENEAWAPIVGQGDQTHLSESTGVVLDPGNYLISVMADGYKVDGAHFSVPQAGDILIEVGLQPHPLPPSTMVIRVFDDSRMTNGQFDTPEVGLEGFRASVNDTAGEITADMYGNPLCTLYEYEPGLDALGRKVVEFDLETGEPVIAKIGGECVSDDEGNITIPNLGTIRFDVLVTPPDGTPWIQTTTLEGSQGWDTWLQEGGTGLDNEFIVRGEPFPWTVFGFVAPTNTMTTTLPITPVGSISGVVMGITAYSPSVGGLPHLGEIWGGLMGAKLERPIVKPWLALNSIDAGDVAVWVGQGKADGSFTIEDVPAGRYFLTYWDEKQHYILDFVQVDVEDGENTDVGVRTMTSWFAEFYGTVFLDTNENGRQDPGEPGVPDYVVVLRDRDNTEIDRMSIASVTDPNGFYELEKGYPMTTWMVLEAYSDIYRTTGVTYQASNQPEETTILGGIVDLAALPILSQRGRVDWGVKFYEPETTGGIGGTTFYDTVRAEDDAAFAGAEPWQPGIPGLTMELYNTVKDLTTGELLTATNGAILSDTLLWVTETEDFERPRGCTVRDVYGDPIQFPSMPDNGADKDCLEGPLTGIQFGNDQQPLPGNWGFGEVCLGGYDRTAGPDAGACISGAVTDMEAGDYLVKVVIEPDPISKDPMYQVTREEDLNMFDGDEFFIQVPPPACAGALHEVDIAGIAPDGTLTTTMDGPDAVVNPGYVEAGGSRFEGMDKPLCNVKLISVAEQKAIAPAFYLWTPVPIPGRWRGYLIDDLNVSSNPLELTFGEKQGLPGLPIGVYDFTGRLVHTIQSDFHGVFETLLPSAATYNTPTPSGMNASMYYIYGNDPGQANNMNTNYSPQYRSIGTTFEIYPGVTVPSDLAPTQNGALIWAPTAQQGQLARCEVDPARPQIFAVDKPWMRRQDATTVTIDGTGFGSTPGDVLLSWTNNAGHRNSDSLGEVIEWSPTQIQVNVGRNDLVGRPYQLQVVNSTGYSSINGLTFHVYGSSYTPEVFEVDPTDPLAYQTIQSALDAAAGFGEFPFNDEEGQETLVVVYPGITNTFTNPLGFWLENPVIYSPVKLQGVGPGGVYTDGTHIQGTILDGRGMGGNENYAGQWRNLVTDIFHNRSHEFSPNNFGWDGSILDGDDNPFIYEGPVVTVFAEDGEFDSRFPVAIDGFTIQGGDQQGMPNNFNNLGQPIPGQRPEIVIQGGGIFVNGYGRHLRITNNVIQGNGGAYAGAIRVGTPELPDTTEKDLQNDDIYIGQNRILANGGTNLAGGIGLFNGAENYEIAYNDICGNTSAEYGGGISHYGYSPGGEIHHNRIVFNRSYDEGGGIMIAGELPREPVKASDGAGAVKVHANLIQGNLANDDGGGLRFLMAGLENFGVYNNIIANNVSTHEGGGISLFDTPYADIYNNTIVKNITTATALTSNGLPAPAGLSSSKNSNVLQGELLQADPTADIFSNPLLFNNIFWDNRAGAWTGQGVVGIGQANDPTGSINYWDLGVSGDYGLLQPTYSLMQVDNLSSIIPDDTNIVGSDPEFIEEYDLGVKVLPWRGNPNFVGADIVAIDLPLGLLGNYHLNLTLTVTSTATTPAVDMGAASVDSVDAPNQDIDKDARPVRQTDLRPPRYDIGADEVPDDFPTTPVLFPPPLVTFQVMADLPPEEGILRFFLPMILKNSSTPPAGWAGQPDRYSFDPSTGVEAKEPGYLFWKTEFGETAEVFFTFTDVSLTATHQDLLLRIGGLTPEQKFGPDTYLIDVGYDATTQEIKVMTLEPGEVWTTLMTVGGINMVAGDRFGARAYGGGILDIYRNQDLVGKLDLTTGNPAWTHGEGTGYIGVWFEGPDFTADPASFVDFGGGTVD